MQANVSPYFELSDIEPISKVEQLLDLNVERQYQNPGEEIKLGKIGSTLYTPHLTAGMFRGQAQDWPLVPKCFRDTLIYESPSSSELSHEWVKATSQFAWFCDRAEAQNPSFPRATLDRMSIAQHFGVPTPLLDWSQSIFSAVFFALRDAGSLLSRQATVFVYHVVDERIFGPELPRDALLSDLTYSRFVKPYDIDRRIGRQRSVFSFHPHPSNCTARVPAKVYALDGSLIERMQKLMKGFGFTEDYYFPDYAGIANSVTSSSHSRA